MDDELPGGQTVGKRLDGALRVNLLHLHSPEDPQRHVAAHQERQTAAARLRMQLGVGGRVAAQAVDDEAGLHEWLQHGQQAVEEQQQGRAASRARSRSQLVGDRHQSEEVEEQRGDE